LSRGRGLRSSRFTEAVEVFSACAGAALYRRGLFAEAGLFEDGFFAYLEDVDWGLRARRRGSICVFAPQAVVYHRGAGTALWDRPGRKAVDSSARVRLIAGNRIRMLMRNYPARFLLAWSPWLAFGLVRSGWYHVFISRQGRAFFQGLREGAGHIAGDRGFFRREDGIGSFEDVAELVRAGERPWGP